MERKETSKLQGWQQPMIYVAATLTADMHVTPDPASGDNIVTEEMSIIILCTMFPLYIFRVNLNIKLLLTRCNFIVYTISEPEHFSQKLY